MKYLKCEYFSYQIMGKSLLISWMKKKNLIISVWGTAKFRTPTKSNKSVVIIGLFSMHVKQKRIPISIVFHFFEFHREAMPARVRSMLVFLLLFFHLWLTHSTARWYHIFVARLRANQYGNKWMNRIQSAQKMQTLTHTQTYIYIRIHKHIHWMAMNHEPDTAVLIVHYDGLLFMMWHFHEIETKTFIKWCSFGCHSRWWSGASIKMVEIFSVHKW